MSGNTYQFRYKTVKRIGTLVSINGPHDRYGYVYAIKEDDVTEEGTLHLIRGTGNQKRRTLWPPL